MNQNELAILSSQGYDETTHNLMDINLPLKGFTTKLQPITQSIITIDALVEGVTFLSAALNQIVNFTASFSDKTLNIAKLEISVVDRLGGLIENLNMEVVNGEGTGAIVVDKPIDYFVTNKGINFHKQAISDELQLTNELVIRVS